MTFFLPALVFIVLILLVIFGTPKPKVKSPEEKTRELVKKLFDDIQKDKK